MGCGSSSNQFHPSFLCVTSTFLTFDYYDFQLLHKMMMQQQSSASLIVFLTIATSLVLSDAFAGLSLRQQQQSPFGLTSYSSKTFSSPSLLYLSADGRQEEVETENETAEPVVDEAAAQESTQKDDVETAEQEEEEEQEDPELVALKEEIAQLESSLKEKRRQVANTNDRAEDFSKAGYARKVAEMENMRRARSVRTIVDLAYFGRTG